MMSEVIYVKYWYNYCNQKTKIIQNESIKKYKFCPRNFP